MKHVMIWLIRLYQKFISPLKPGCCRFTPTCSQYAIEAFQKRGFFIGFILSVWRILRCNPFCKGGYDPVPEHGLRRVRTEIEETTGTEPVAECKKDAQEAAEHTISEDTSSKDTESGSDL